MCAECLQDFPHGLVAAVAVEGFFWGFAGLDDYGKDDVAAGFARSFAHDSSDGLHNVDLGAFGADEDYCVESRNVNALAQAARVAEDAACVLFWRILEPLYGG